MNVVTDNILDLIGNTPMVDLSKTTGLPIYAMYCRFLEFSLPALLTCLLFQVLLSPSASFYIKCTPCQGQIKKKGFLFSNQ